MLESAHSHDSALASRVVKSLAPLLIRSRFIRAAYSTLGMTRAGGGDPGQPSCAVPRYVTRFRPHPLGA